MLWMLFALLVSYVDRVCNVASLILARSSSRLREFAVRASRGQQRSAFRQLQAEASLWRSVAESGLFAGKVGLGAMQA